MQRGKSKRSLWFAAGFASVLASTTAAAQEDPPAADAPAPTAPASSPGAAEQLEQAHVSARSPFQLLQLGLAYASLADSGGDPWDAVLALTYFERGLAINPGLATPELQATMARMRQLAGRRPYQPPLSDARYPVYFSAYDEDDLYVVSAHDGRCTTPCTLALPAGPQAIRTTGEGEIETEIFVPTEPSRVRLQADSSGQEVAGAVLIPVGVAVGAGMWAIGLACNGPDSTGCLLANIIGWPVAGVSMITTGIVLLATAKDLPCDANRVARAGLAPWLTPGPTGELEVTGAVGALTATF